MAVDPNVIVDGVVSTSRGAPPSGTAVKLTYTPLDGVDGELVPSYYIGKGITDSLGNFTVSVDPTRLPAVAAAAKDANGGILNLDLSVITPNGERSEVGISRGLDASGAWENTGAVEDASTGLTEYMVAGSPAEVLGETEYASSTTSASAVGSYCSWYYYSTTPRSTRIFDAHSSAKTTLEWHYGESASSSIDYAAQFSPTGAFGVQGSYGMANTAGAEVGTTVSGVKHARGTTEFAYKTLIMKADNPRATFCTNYTNLPGSKKVGPIRWQGGIGYVDTLSAGTCGSSYNSLKRASYVKNGYMIKSDSKTQKISGAVSLGGASLGAITSYERTRTDNKALWAKWTFAYGSGYLCGNNGPPSSAQVVYVSS